MPFVTAFGWVDYTEVYEPEELSCVANSGFVKCARLPTDVYNKNASNAELYAHVDVGTRVDDSNWTHFRNGVPIVGHAENVTVTPMGSMFVTSADCVVTEPFNVKFVGEVASGVGQPGTSACLYVAQTVGSGEAPSDAMIVGTATALDGDVCPDGFFTVLYESWCGEGMVNISDAPNCDDDASGEFCLVDMSSSSSSTCESTDTVTKCARLPTDFMRFNIEGAGDYTDSSWSIIYDGVVYSGNSAECMELKIGHSCQCVVNSPFNAVIEISTGLMQFGTAYEACSGMLEAEMVASYVFDGRLDGDMCPDGFYTVPYEMSCGEGLVDVAGVPECENDVSGDYCLMPPSSTSSTCVSTDTVTKCARLPEGVRMSPNTLQDANSADDVSWSSLLYDHQSYPEIIDTHQIAISGTARVDSWDVVCTITSPFYAEVMCGFGADMPSYVSSANSCAEWDCDMSAEIHASALPNDVCPDGFYTVPYDVSCGVGLVEVSNIPQCDTDTSGEFCFIGDMPVTPCAAGITTLRTGTGVSIPLWAERGTEPSLCVKYNDMVCYGNLEPGQATGAINVKYGGAVYHTVD